MPLSSSPRVQKGALARLDDRGQPAETVVFQYNPEELHHTIEEHPAPGRRSPREVIACTLELDATDALERPDDNPVVVRYGIAPTLAALELLMHRRETRARRWWELWRPGDRAEGRPLALFVWGEGRVVPVRVVRLDVTERMHDPALLPIRATVEVTMRVVTEDDLPRGDPAIAHWRRHVERIEALSRDA
jgi:hypothetical protein